MFGNTAVNIVNTSATNAVHAVLKVKISVSRIVKSVPINSLILKLIHLLIIYSKHLVIHLS